MNSDNVTAPAAPAAYVLMAWQQDDRQAERFQRRSLTRHKHFDSLMSRYEMSTIQEARSVLADLVDTAGGDSAHAETVPLNRILTVGRMHFQISPVNA